MKNKIIASITAFALMTLLALPISASTQITDLTADVPSTYTLSIPISQTIATIAFGNTTTNIGNVAITGSIRPLEEVAVDVTKTVFESQDNVNDKINYTLTSDGNDFTGATWGESQLRGANPPTYPLTVNITQQEWNKAPAGNYASVITFTAGIRPIV